ncbi:hypothetical protein JCM8547_002814 [Rhodosporidiobolus lusitaniae]
MPSKKSALAPPPDASLQRLSSSPSLRGCTNHELVKRLSALHHQLRDFDQDHVDTASLDQVAKDLVHPSLLLHKDKGVKAYAGACLVDILRLYAPDAPYTPNELKDLFDFLIRQFQHVGSPSDPHQSEYFYIVDSLASVKSIVIVCDLDAAEELTERVFRESFDTISSSSPKNVEIALSDILLSLLEELPSIPSSITDTLTSQFLPKNIKLRPAAFRLAQEVCKGASDKLQRYVSQYFAETLVGTLEGGVRGSSDEEDESETDDDSDVGRGKRRGKGKGKAKAVKGGKGKGKSSSADDLPDSLLEAHDLIRSLHRHCPSLLLSVIPLLESELVSPKSPSYRRLATSVLGRMFAEPQGHGDLARDFPGTWREWGNRSKDRDAKVRMELAQRAGRVVRERPELGKDVEAILLRLLLDPDEKVRLAAVSAFDPDPDTPLDTSSSSLSKEKNGDKEKRKKGMEYETAKHHVSRKCLMAVGERVGDKKDKVRAAAFKVLGRLYDLAYPEIESRDDHALSQFGWIPEKILGSLTLGGDYATQRHLVDLTFSLHLLPRPRTEKDASDPDVVASWVDRFLTVERGVKDERQKEALMSLTKLAERVGEGSGGGGNPFEGFVQAAEKYNAGIGHDSDTKEVILQFLKRCIRGIVAYMPDSSHAAEDLHNFAKENVQQMYKELRVMMDSQTDLKTFVKNERDFLRRLEKFPSPLSSLQTFTSLLRLSCPIYISRSSIPQLLKRLQSGSPSSGASQAHPSEADEMAASAARVLEYVSRTRPAVYKGNAAELGKAVLEAKVGEEGGKRAEVVLQAWANLKRADASVVVDGRLSKRALEFAKEGTEKQAKYAATLVALDTARAGTIDDLVDSLSEFLGADVDDELAPHLAALGRIARYGHEAFETKSEVVTAAALEVLTRSGGKKEATDDDDLTYLSDADLVPLTRARLLSVKILVNRCLAYAKTDSAAKVAKPVFEMLWNMLGMQGGGEETYSVPVASRLRLSAALSLLKLLASNDPGYIKQILDKLDLLSRLAQDATFEVREQFLKKLVHYLREGRMHAQIRPRLNMVVFLVAHEPDEDLKNAVVAFAAHRRKLPEKERQQQWEAPFLRLLHMLAHHPDFEGSEAGLDELNSMAKYIELYFEIFASAENVSYLFYLANAVKNVQDKKAKGQSEHLYILSELAQHLLKAVAKKNGWPISTYPGRVAMPPDLFVKHDTPEAAKKVAQTTYIEESLLAKLEVKPEKKKSAPRKRVSTATNGAPKPKRARTTPSKPRAGGSAKKGKAKKEWDSDEEDGEDDESSPEEEEELDEEESDEEVDGSGGEKNGKEKGGKKPRPPPRGSRGNLRSDPKKEVVKGLGQSSDDEKDEGEDENGMDVDGADGASGSEEDAVPKKGKKAAAAATTPKKTAAAKAKASTPAKGKSPAAAAAKGKGKKAAASPPPAAAKKAAKGKAAAKKKAEKEDAAPRKALRGLKQPRAMKKGMDVEEVSDVGDTDEEEEEKMDGDDE